MATFLQMQALSSANGQLYSWLSAAADFVGTGYPGPGTPLDIAVASAPSGPAGSSGTSAGAVPVTVMIDSPANINLAAGPTAFDGYTLVNGDVCGLRLQNTTANNCLYTFGTGGVFTPLASQPPNGASIITIKGANPFKIFYYQPTVISPLNSASAGTIVGANGTTVSYAPDPAGGASKAIGNEAIDVTALTAATPVVLWQYDFVGRNFTTGVLFVEACFIQKTNSGKAVTSRIECVMFAGNPPTFHNDAQQYDIDDSSGAGGYGPLTFSIVGSVLKLSCTPTLAGSGFGLVSFMAGNI